MVIIFVVVESSIIQSKSPLSYFVLAFTKKFCNCRKQPFFVNSTCFFIKTPLMLTVIMVVPTIQCHMHEDMKKPLVYILFHYIFTILFCELRAFFFLPSLKFFSFVLINFWSLPFCFLPTNFNFWHLMGLQFYFFNFGQFGGFFFFFNVKFGGLWL